MSKIVGSNYILEPTMKGIIVSKNEENANEELIEIDVDSIMEDVLLQFAIFWNRKNGDEIGIPDPVDIREFIYKIKREKQTKKANKGGLSHFEERMARIMHYLKGSTTAPAEEQSWWAEIQELKKLAQEEILKWEI